IEPARAVLEVLETVPVTPQLIEALRGFKARGYRIALDDFVLDPRTRELAPLADVIKLDVLGQARDKITADAAALRAAMTPGARLLAERVSTGEALAFLRTLGFDLYQGFFLEKPIIARTRRLPHNRATLMQLLARLYDPRLDLRELEKIL